MATARAPSAYRRGRPGSASTSPMWSSTSSPTRPAITTAWNPSGAAPPRNSGKDKEDRNSAPESASQHIDTHPLRAYTLGAFGAVAQPGERHAGSVEVTGSIPVGSTLGEMHLNVELRSRLNFFC